MSTKNELPTHKALAKQAKKRLGSGYWQQMKQERNLYFEQNNAQPCNIVSLNETFKRRIEREIRQQTEEDPDAILYKKVCKLLSENEYVLNPIAQLVDHEVYDKLDDSAKQNYMFRLADKYRKLKERYEKEKCNNKFAVN